MQGEPSSWTKGIIALQRDGQLRSNGKTTYGHHKRWEVGDVLCIEFAADGGSFEWTVNKEPQAAVSVSLDSCGVLFVAGSAVWRSMGSEAEATPPPPMALYERGQHGGRYDY